MKTITEAELTQQYSLQPKSRTAMITFVCGLSGLILCIVLFILVQRYFSEMQQIIADSKANLEMNPNERIELNELVFRKTEAFGNLAIPLFLAANFLWIGGGFSWSFDLYRQPSNASLRKIGGILVLITAATCCLWWAYLISRYFQGAGTD
ncbi:MAG: hypothetical protein VX438_01920 [Planctomycetota bacterium]|nr:hypothetical protein [Planctomycetota bacterium]